MIQLVIFTVLLYGIHYYLLNLFYDEKLFFAIWKIYLFNVVLVLIMFLILSYISSKKSKQVLQYFLGLTMLKMILAILFLLPLFLEKSQPKQFEVINFFIPYFLFLTFEIFSLNKIINKN